jgi:sarcosine oxidase delta subunit
MDQLPVVPLKKVVGSSKDRDSLMMRLGQDEAGPSDVNWVCEGGCRRWEVVVRDELPVLGAAGERG